MRALPRDDPQVPAQTIRSGFFTRVGDHLEIGADIHSTPLIIGDVVTV